MRRAAPLCSMTMACAGALAATGPFLFSGSHWTSFIVLVGLGAIPAAVAGWTTMPRFLSNEPWSRRVVVRAGLGGLLTAVWAILAASLIAGTFIGVPNLTGGGDKVGLIMFAFWIGGPILIATPGGIPFGIAGGIMAQWLWTKRTQDLWRPPSGAGSP